MNIKWKNNTLDTFHCHQAKVGPYMLYVYQMAIASLYEHYAWGVVYIKDDVEWDFAKRKTNFSPEDCRVIAQGEEQVPIPMMTMIRMPHHYPDEVIKKCKRKAEGSLMKEAEDAIHEWFE